MGAFIDRNRTFPIGFRLKAESGSDSAHLQPDGEDLREWKRHIEAGNPAARRGAVPSGPDKGHSDSHDILAQVTPGEKQAFDRLDAIKFQGLVAGACPPSAEFKVRNGTIVHVGKEELEGLIREQEANLKSPPRGLEKPTGHEGRAGKNAKREEKSLRGNCRC
jgi:hypothetical protein